MGIFVHILSSRRVESGSEAPDIITSPHKKYRCRQDVLHSQEASRRQKFFNISVQFSLNVAKKFLYINIPAKKYLIANKNFIIAYQYRFVKFACSLSPRFSAPILRKTPHGNQAKIFVKQQKKRE